MSRPPIPTATAATAVALAALGALAALVSGPAAAAPLATSSPPTALRAAVRDALPLDSPLFAGPAAARFADVAAAWGPHVQDPGQHAAVLASLLDQRAGSLSPLGAALTAIPYWVATDFLDAHDRWLAGGGAPALPVGDLERFARLPGLLASGAVHVGVTPAAEGELVNAWDALTDTITLARPLLDDPSGALFESQAGAPARRELLASLHLATADMGTPTSMGESELLARAHLFAARAALILDGPAAALAHIDGISSRTAAGTLALQERAVGQSAQLLARFGRILVERFPPGAHERAALAVAERQLAGDAPELPAAFLRAEASEAAQAAVFLAADHWLRTETRQSLAGRVLVMRHAGLEPDQVLDPADPRLELESVRDELVRNSPFGPYALYVGLQIAQAGVRAPDELPAFLDAVVFPPALEHVTDEVLGRRRDLDGSLAKRAR